MFSVAPEPAPKPSKKLDSSKFDLFKSEPAKPESTKSEPTKPEPVKAPKPEPTKPSIEITQSEIPIIEEPLEKAPIVVKEIVDTEFKPDDEGVLDVYIEGNPPPSIQWFIDDDELYEESGIVFVNDHPHYQIRIEALIKDDEGLYACVATNSAGTVTSKGHLTVVEPVPEPVKQVKPVIEVPDELRDGLHLKEGDEARFELTCEGASHTFWKKEGMEIQPSDKFTVRQEGNTFILVINNVQIDDSASYSFVAENETGVEEVPISVNVTGKESS